MPPKRATRRSAEAITRISVQRAVAAPGAPSSVRLARWARAAARGRTLVTLRLVGAAEGRRLNRAFRGRDYATDVLTFVYGRRPFVGDVVLCHPVVARAARERGLALDAHYAHLVVHGLLHLRGHDHERDADATRMERAEARLLASFGFADPTAVESGPRTSRRGRPAP